MSTWTTPITWANGAVAAATVNTEVRDHLNWLKGAIDLITASTASDVGTTTRLGIIRTNASDDVLQGRVTGDANPRVTINADGGYDIGPGSAGTDVRIRRDAAGSLLVDNGAGGAASLGSVGAVRAGAGTTDEIALDNGYIYMAERADVPSGNITPNHGAAYFRDNGSGKTQYVVRFTTGAAIVLATQA